MRFLVFATVRTGGWSDNDLGWNPAKEPALERCAPVVLTYTAGFAYYWTGRLFESSFPRWISFALLDFWDSFRDSR